MKKEFFESSVDNALEKASSVLAIPKEKLKYKVVDQELGSALKKRVAVIVEFDDNQLKLNREKEMRYLDERELPPSEHADYAAYLVDGIFRRMNMETKTTHRKVQDQCILTVQMNEQDLDLRKGRGRELRGAIQHLINRAMARLGEDHSRYIVDIGGSLEDRSKNIQQLTETVSKNVLKMGKKLHIHLMDSQDRRLLHLGLSENLKLSTRGQGKKQFRVLSVEPTDCGK